MINCLPAMAEDLLRIVPMVPAEIDQVREFEAINLAQPQVLIETIHHIHAGIYARTIVIPAGVVITGALITRATLLIVKGDAVVYTGNGGIEVSGYKILPASANRKQVIVANTETTLTMLFPTQAKTVEDAEAEFTDEANMLWSRQKSAINQVIITGE